MCECCLAQCDDYGEVLPGWYLVRATRDSEIGMENDDWGLVRCNGPEFVFEATPIKDPTSGMSDEELDNPELDKPFDQFVEVAESIGKDMFGSVDISVPSAPFFAYGELYAACVEAGAKRDGHIFHWLCNHMATYLGGNPDVRRWKDEYPATDTGE